MPETRHDTAHQTAGLVSGAPLLLVDGVTTILWTNTAIETLPMNNTQLRVTPSDLQGMKGTDMKDRIPTRVLDHRSAMHMATVQYTGIIQGVATLLNIMRTDITFITLQVLDMSGFTLLTTW